MSPLRVGRGLPMIVEKSMHPDWLSNTWLVADRPGGRAVLIDTGGPPEPILEKIAALGLSLTDVLCTHHHIDHVAHNTLYRSRYGAEIHGHASERALFGDLDHELDDGDELEAGDLLIRALHIPGHTLGQLAFVVNDERVFTGDTLFRGSIGGTRGPGHTTYEDIRRSIMDVLMGLPHEMPAHPGHTDETTIGREWEKNVFIRAWRGLDATADTPCTAFGEPATLRLRGADYDGGFKCWVRFEGSGEEAIVPGSRVEDRP